MVNFQYNCSYNILKAWMQKDSDKPLGAEKHLLAGAIAGKEQISLEYYRYLYSPTNYL